MYIPNRVWPLLSCLSLDIMTNTARMEPFCIHTYILITSFAKMHITLIEIVRYCSKSAAISTYCTTIQLASQSLHKDIVLP